MFRNSIFSGGLPLNVRRIRQDVTFRLWFFVYGRHGPRMVRSVMEMHVLANRLSCPEHPQRGLWSFLSLADILIKSGGLL